MDEIRGELKRDCSLNPERVELGFFMFNSFRVRLWSAFHYFFTAFHTVLFMLNPFRIQNYTSNEGYTLIQPHYENNHAL